MSYVYANIVNKDSKYILASLLVFRSFLQPAPSDEIQKQINDGFKSFLNLLQHEDPMIVQFTLLLFIETAEYQPEVLFQEENTQMLIQKITSFFSQQYINDIGIIISSQGLEILDKMGE